MTVEFRTPSETESDLMREFGVLVSNGVEMIMRHEVGNYGGVVVQKLQEAMFWHSHALLNKEPPKEGEVLEKDPTVN